MSLQEMLTALEHAAVRREPLLKARLQPGLSEREIRRTLLRHEVQGNLEAVIAAYEWRNGTVLDAELVARKRGFFPAAKPYYFLDLEMAVGHLGHWRAVARRRRELADGRSYFPLFWDGSTGWIAADLASTQNRVMTVEHSAEVPFAEAYGSFEDFLRAAVHGIDAAERLLLPGVREDLTTDEDE